MVNSSGFAHTPVTLGLILVSSTLTIGLSIMDVKHLLPIRPQPHLWPYLQLSRLLTYQSAYLNASELLFSTVLFYQLRVLERLWGSRKYLSFVVVCAAVNVWLTPLVLVTLVRAVSLARWNYLPPGWTGVVCAGVACWTEEVPSLWRWRLVTSSAAAGPSSSSHTGGGTTVGVEQEQEQQQGQDRSGSGPRSGSSRSPPGVTLSDKSTTYVLVSQLALSQFPYNLLPAAMGWMVGLAWRAELLPAGVSRWRVPAWTVGEGGKGKGIHGEERERYEGLRRRLEEESGGHDDGMRNATTNGIGGVGGGGVQGPDASTARRGVGSQVLDYFRGVF